MEEVIQELENVSKILFKWFSDNQMKANPDKYHFLTGFNSEIGITVENEKIASTKFVKLPRVKDDFILNLNFHVHEISKKAEQKLNKILRGFK